MAVGVERFLKLSDKHPNPVIRYRGSVAFLNPKMSFHKLTNPLTELFVSDLQVEGYAPGRFSEYNVTYSNGQRRKEAISPYRRDTDIARHHGRIMNNVSNPRDRTICNGVTDGRLANMIRQLRSRSTYRTKPLIIPRRGTSN